METAYEWGWATLNNGVLRHMAEEAGFDVMITTDQGIATSRISPDWTRIRQSKSIVVAAMSEIPAATVPATGARGSFLDIEIPFDQR
ncbi:MAG: hypothetical protein LAP87_08015 [Acidobacteriia bacterium]|nr:hypothetical protein [Terriglobia bacterium]